MMDFTQMSSQLDQALQDSITRSHSQFCDTTSTFNGKSKSAVLEQGAFTRSVLVDAVFSLNTVCKSLFESVLTLTKNQGSNGIDDVLSRVENAVKNGFDSLVQHLPQSAPNQAEYPALSNAAVENKDRHVILLKEKDSSDEAKYDQSSWSNVVKGTLQNQLRNIPVNKSLLNKSGQGCLIFPSKKAQEDAEAVLQPLFDVRADNRPRKAVLPKIKVFDVDTELYHDKAVLKQAVLEKNPDIHELATNDSDFEVVLINKTLKFCVLKVSPGIRKLIVKRGHLFLGMNSHRIRDHFQPLQCFACQGFGHKQGAPECKHYERGTTTCLYCCGNHLSKDCKDKRNPHKHKCSNCISSKNPHERSNASHKSTSLKCPFIIREMNALIKRTTGLTEGDVKNLKLQPC